MVKLLVFAILLASSPASGLLETLFQTESSCYKGCQANYGDSTANVARLLACQQGCDYKLYNGDCANQCKLYSNDDQNVASCQVGCTLSGSGANVALPPMVAVDPIPESLTTPSTSEPDRPRSIIIIRLRQRPSIDMPSMENVFNSDPIQMFNDIIRRFQEKAQSFELPKDGLKLPTPDAANEFIKSIPLISIPKVVQKDSSSESSESSESNEEKNGQHSLFKEIKHILHHPREQQQMIRERMEPMNSRLHQFVSNVRNRWNNLVQNQPKIPVWIFLCILLSSSIILWYMLMSLCRHRPTYKPLSIRAQELVFHPYEYEGYEKEKIQPDSDVYEVTESLPIKVKLSNI